MTYVVPVDVCIANYKDFQLFHIMNILSDSVILGFFTYENEILCQRFLDKRDWEYLSQANIKNYCSYGENYLAIEIYPFFPKINQMLQGYTEE